MITFDSTDVKIRLSTCSTTCTLYSTILSISTTSTKSRRLVTATFASLGYHIETETNMQGILWYINNLKLVVFCRHVALMSLQLIKELVDFRVPHLPTERINIRIGIHCGMESSLIVGIANSLHLHFFFKKWSFETPRIGSKYSSKYLDVKSIVSFDEMVLHPKSARNFGIVGC